MGEHRVNLTPTLAFSRQGVGGAVEPSAQEWCRQS
jgi:hypothetical protein